MATVSWDVMVPMLAPFVPGTPDASMRTALAQSTNEFLSKTHLWRSHLDPQVVTAGTTEVELYADGVIESIIMASFGPVRLTQTDLRLTLNAVDRQSTPTHFWMIDDSILRLYPSPDADGELNVYAALKTSRTASGVESWIYETWADALVDGAVARLSQIPGKSWTDQQMSDEHRLRFARAMDDARVRDYQQINLRVRPQHF